MDANMGSYFLGLAPSRKIIYLLKNHDDFKGPQPTIKLEKFLNMKRKNIDSLLSRLCIKGKIIRISPGVYAHHNNEKK
jgi:predicted transcriptional regulator of viral defense system